MSYKSNFLYKRFTSVFLQFFIYCSPAWSSAPALDYTEICDYVRFPQIKFEKGLVDLSSVHASMGAIEYAYCEDKNTKEKNVSLLRITPVYLNDDGNGYSLGESYKITAKFGSEQQVEVCFLSSFSPELPKTDPSVDHKCFTDKEFICSSILNPSGVDKVCIVTRHASYISKIVGDLSGRFSGIDHESISGKWYDKTIKSKLEKIKELNSSEPLPVVNSFSTLCKYGKIICDATSLVKPDTMMKMGSLACSEQHSLSFLPEALKEMLRKDKDHRQIQSLVISMHTTKHPCYTCGFSTYVETSRLMENPAIFLPKPEYFNSKERLAEGFRIQSLISYRDSYEELPEYKKYEKLPETSKVFVKMKPIASTGGSEISIPTKLSKDYGSAKIGIIPMPMKKVTSYSLLYPATGVSAAHYETVAGSVTGSAVGGAAAAAGAACGGDGTKD